MLTRPLLSTALRQSTTSWRHIAMIHSVIQSSSFAGCARSPTAHDLEQTLSLRTVSSRSSEFCRRLLHPHPQHRSILYRAAHFNAADSEAIVDDVRVIDNGRFVVVKSRGDDVLRSMRFHATWLRHNCQCELCVQKHSGQKLIRPAELADSYSVESTEIAAPDTDVTASERSVIRIKWREDNGSHVSKFPIAYLIAKEPRSAAHQLAENKPTKVISTGSPLPTIDYEELMSDIGDARQKVLLRMVHLVNEYGVCRIRRVPVGGAEYQVNRVAELIGPVLDSMYGKTWHTRADPVPVNIANTDVALGFHMDLAYYESPPGLQFMHVIEFDACVEGGESLFVDAWHVAETMRTLHPDEFRTLTRIPATFQKIHFDRDQPVFMTYQRPHIAVEPQTDSIIGITWAPAFEGPLDQVEDADMDRYFKAYTTFARLLESSSTRVETLLDLGDVVCINNRRILHGRNAFKLNGGGRHIVGCYVNIDDFKSRLRVLMATQTDKEVTVAPVKRVFNQSWS